MKIYEVVWDDHAMYSGPFREERTLALQTSVGYLVQDNEQCVVLAMSLEDNDEDEEVPMECLYIDPRMIRSKERLK